MGIEAVNNTSINANSLSGFKSNIETSAPNQNSNDFELKSTEEVAESTSSDAFKSFSENNDEQQKILDDAIQKLNEAANIIHCSLKFSIHEATKRTMISVIDTENDKVIREIPSEEALDMAAKMQDYIGMIFDKKA